MAFAGGALIQARVHAKHFEGGVDNGVLGAETIFIWESQTAGTKLAASASVDQYEIDPDLLAGGVKTALQNKIHAKLLARRVNALDVHAANFWGGDYLEEADRE